ncbi:MAG: hypothetical protein R3F30_15810 [Planctomycetota bacterium]
MDVLLATTGQCGGLDGVEPPIVEARTWLLRTGWRRHGLVDLTERPA